MYYVDDVLSAKLDDHIDTLDEDFICMKQAGFKSTPLKCKILRDSTKYLGRMTDRHEIRSKPEAVEAVLMSKAPKTDVKLMSSLLFAIQSAH